MESPRPASDDHTAAGRQALREIASALAFVLAVLAAVLAVALASGHDSTAVAAAIALLLAAAVVVVAMRRATRVATLRDAAIEQERQGREQLDRTLAATRQLVQIDSPPDLRRRICELARDVFDCSAVSLWEVEPESLRLLERVPWAHPYRGGDRRPIAELPGLREALDWACPLFVEDLATGSSGLTQATAEIIGTGSLLNVPVASGGLARLDLVLTWDRRLPPPGATGLVAVQRFADQAALALEQSLHRAAQAEIASLNRTLQRMVQTDPLFHAGGSPEEVAAAICSEGLGVFEADGAALWVEDGDAIVLIRREPPAAVFGSRQHILFSEHPTFAEDLEAGRPHFLADVEHDDPVLWERFARHSGSRSQLRLPLASAGSARALIILSWSRLIAPPSAEISAVAARFADQAGVALAEAARRDAQRAAGDLHARFEQSLLPSISLASPGVSAATFYRPGDERLSLGGDFYDCLELGDGAIAMLVGDVAGHGAAAAALGAGLRSAWRALTLGGWELEDLPRGLQAVCVRERGDPYQFVTAVLARVDPARRSVRFVCAGHPPPLVLGAGGVADEVHGPPLGVVAGASWPAAEIPLDAQATVLLYTDGLVEGRAAPGARERLGLPAVLDALRAARAGAVTEADLRALVDRAAAAHGEGLPDDVALLALNVAR